MSDRTIITFLSICVVGLLIALIAKPAPQTAPAEPAQVQTVRPKTTHELAPNAAMIKREDDGHYWSRADVNGSTIKFLVDTGASVVALTWRDAQRLRLEPESLDFKWKIQTANGETLAASVLIPYIRIGNVKVENVEAMVMKDGLLENSLLGISFLEQLYSYEFKGDRLIIRL